MIEGAIVARMHRSLLCDGEDFGIVHSCSVCKALVDGLQSRLTSGNSSLWAVDHQRGLQSPTHDYWKSARLPLVGDRHAVLSREAKVAVSIIEIRWADCKVALGMCFISRQQFRLLKQKQVI